jgi:hypothetical protein
MLISADQILAHLIGDYILQSDWMANEKRKRSVAALVHALWYSLPFMFFAPSMAAVAFIVGTHFLIDRFGLARYVVWLKNFIGPPRFDTRRDAFLGVFPDIRFAGNPWRECSATGYHESRPVWLTTWLLIIADNTLHLICNGIALRWL